MKEFLDWLKEECLPGIWSKGVQASRSAKSIEKISPEHETRELRFKVTSPERVIAFEVTLWPGDQDAHCNCGNKAQPCHHIVSAALAVANGTLRASSDAAEASPAPKLVYRWEYRSDPDGSGKLSLRRSIASGGTETPVPSSLIAWIGGIKSGRIKGALPAVTANDLALDELYARETPEWPEVLRILRNFPPIPLEGHPEWRELTVRAQSGVPVLQVRALAINTFRIGPLEDESRGEILKNGLRIRDGMLECGSTRPVFRERVLRSSEITEFVLNELPRLREEYEVLDPDGALPAIHDGTPGIQIKIEALAGERFAVTAVLEYDPPPEGSVLRRNASAERTLAREVRDSMNLSPGDPRIVTASELLNLREKTRFPGAKEAFDGVLGAYLDRTAGISIESALPCLESVRAILRIRESQPAERDRTGALLSRLVARVPVPEKERSGLIPQTIAGVLREYQKTGVNWLSDRSRHLGGAILADDMGLGKTLQTLAVLEAPSLVVVPTSLLGGWKSEAARFRPDLSVSVYHGPDRAWNPASGLTLTTYALLRQESERFSSQDWKCVVLDEAHLIRNPETQAAIAACSLNGNFRLALTGTPIQNRKRDLESLFQFIAPGLFQDESELRADLIAPFVLRRTKEQVLPELPPKTRIEHGILLREEERRFYDSLFLAAKKEILSRLDGGETLSPLTFFEVLLRSRQACSHRRLIRPSEGTPRSSKLDAILGLLSELNEAGHSVLVYSQWTGFLDLLEEELRGRTPCHRLDGATRDREGVVRGFQEDSSPSVFLLSLHAGGVGLNLVKATHVVFCEPWWNPQVELQAEDRAFRMGQEKPVTIHRFLATDTVEMAIRDLQKQKLALGEEWFTATELRKLVLEE